MQLLESTGVELTDRLLTIENYMLEISFNVSL